MRFNIITNRTIEMHNNYFTLLLRHTLADLGHQVVVTEPLPIPDAIEVVFFINFWTDRALIDRVTSSRHGYVLYFQEIFKSDGFNQVVVEEKFQKIFHEAYRRARLIVTPFIQNIEPLSKFNEAIAYCPLAFNPSIETIRLSSTPLFDVFFFGGMDERGRRSGILNRIAGKKLSVVTLGAGVTTVCRDSLISAAKLCPNISLEPEYRHISPRVAFLANNRVCCPSNVAEDPDGYLEFAVPFETDEELIAGCKELVTGNTYRHAGERAYDAFRRTSSVDIMEKAFDEHLR